MLEAKWHGLYKVKDFWDILGMWAGDFKYRKWLWYLELDGCFLVFLESSGNSLKKLMESNNQGEKLLAVFAKGLISFIQNDYLQIKKEANALRKPDWENEQMVRE